MKRKGKEWRAIETKRKRKGRRRTEAEKKRRQKNKFAMELRSEEPKWKEMVHKRLDLRR